MPPAVPPAKLDPVFPLGRVAGTVAAVVPGIAQRGPREADAEGDGEGKEHCGSRCSCGQGGQLEGGRVGIDEEGGHPS